MSSAAGGRRVIDCDSGKAQACPAEQHPKVDRPSIQSCRTTSVFAPYIPALNGGVLPRVG